LANLSNRSEIASALQRSSNSAQQAGVTFDELASYVTIVSSVTRKSAESIGESFKTMFARMETIKLGQMFEDEATTINDVEKALSLVDIQLRDSETSFRDMGDVFDEVAIKWDTMNELEQSAVATAIAGTRQRENFLVLMRNYNQVIDAQTIETEAAGLAQQRYSIYLDSVEAATNRLTAAWEKMFAGALTSDTLKFFINLGTTLVGTIEKLGLLNVAITALTMYGFAKLGTAIPIVGSALKSLTVTFQLLGISASTASALMGGVFAIALIGVIAIFDKLNVTMTETYDKFEKLKAESEANQEELKSLATEYEELANKQSKTADETIRLLDIQTILNTKYGASKEGITAYSDAIDGNSEKIKENIAWLQKKAQQEASNFMLENKYAYQEAKDLIDKSKWMPVSGTSSFVEGNIEERIEALDKVIEKYGDATGAVKRQRDALSAEYIAAQDLVIEYEHYNNELKVTTEIDASGATDDITESLSDLTSAANSATKSLSSAVNTALDLIDSYSEYGQLSLDQMLQLQEAFPTEYMDMLYEENGQIKLNTEALKALVTARAYDAFTAAYEALQTADTANAAYDAAKITNLASQEVAAASLTSLETAVSAATYAGMIRSAMGGGSVGSPIDTSALKNSLAIAESFYNNLKSGAFWTDQATQALYGYAGATNSASDSQSNYNDLLKDTISMLKQKKEDEKDALKEQLDGYKNIIDAQKKILDQQQEEDDYQDSLNEKNKELSDIESELLQIQFDNSDAAKKRRLELEDEKAKKIEEIDEFQADRGVEIQKDALDEEYEDYESKIEDKISAIEDYLKKTGVIEAEAISLLSSRTQAFYNDLLEWNRLYGTGIDNDIISKWNEATSAASQYGSVASGVIASVASGAVLSATLTALISSKQSDYKAVIVGGDARYQNKKTGAYISSEYYHGLPAYHNGGIVGMSAPTKENEILATLLKGEIVTNTSQAYNFITKTLPSIMSASNAMGNMSPSVTINIEGDVDDKTLPKIEASALKGINKAIADRGIKRDGTKYSI
jgi:hypothetical protein